MLITLLCAHVMTKHVCKISHLNSKRLLRKLQKKLGGYFILPHPVDLSNAAVQSSGVDRGNTTQGVFSDIINLAGVD